MPGLLKTKSFRKFMGDISVTVMIPIRNSVTVLKDVLQSLEKQNYPLREIILIDNNSTDSSWKIMSQYAKISRYPIRLIKHKKDYGLSYSYNEAIKLTRATHLITLQSDCVIAEKNGITKLIQPWKNGSKVVATCSMQTTPKEIWENYNFWQKCLFSRHVGKILSGRNCRFCCFSVPALKKIGMFDKKTYRTAGEDGDLFFKLSRIGIIVDVHDLVVRHIHSKNKFFTMRDYIHKENQLAEAVGACLSKNFSKIPSRNYLTAFLRPILLTGLLIPKLNFLFFGLIIFSSIFFTHNTFKNEWKNPLIIVLPFVNIFLLFSYTFYFFKGFILQKQTL